MAALEHLTDLPLDLKFGDSLSPGSFTGYGAIWGNMDSHGDVIKPGAFTRTLAEHKAAGTMPKLFVDHGAANEGLPAGVYTDMVEDEKGLFTKGRLSGMNTERGQYLRELINDKALTGQSIGFRVYPGGAEFSKAAGSRRTLTSVELAEVSIVGFPSNKSAQVIGIKGMFKPDTSAAATAVAAAMRAHHQTMSSSDYSSDSTKRKAVIMNHLRDAHEALTGDRAPSDLPDWKSAAEIKAALIAAGISAEQADIAAAAAMESKASPIQSVTELTGYLRSLNK